MKKLKRYWTDYNGPRFATNNTVQAFTADKMKTLIDVKATKPNLIDAVWQEQFGFSCKRAELEKWGKSDLLEAAENNNLLF